MILRGKTCTEAPPIPVTQPPGGRCRNLRLRSDCLAGKTGLWSVPLGGGFRSWGVLRLGGVVLCEGVALGGTFGLVKSRTAYRAIINNTTNCYCFILKKLCSTSRVKLNAFCDLSLSFKTTCYLRPKNRKPEMESQIRGGTVQNILNVFAGYTVRSKVRIKKMYNLSEKINWPKYNGDLVWLTRFAREQRALYL